MKSKVFGYICYFIPTSVFLLSVWSFLISPNLFYCSDWDPYFDFIPPFVYGPQNGDYFIVDQKLVWLIWLFFIILIIFIPSYLVMLDERREIATKKKAHIKKYSLSKK